jgi:hemolysin III
MFPQYTVRERIADGCIHVVGVTASVVALTALLILGVRAQATLWIVSLSIYGLALVAMFTCSAGYNLIVRPSRPRRHLSPDRGHVYAVRANEDGR